MFMLFNKNKNVKIKHLPEHGPIDESGKEILLSLENVDITFGKGDRAVRAVKNASFDIYKGECLSFVNIKRCVLNSSYSFVTFTKGDVNILE